MKKIILKDALIENTIDKLKEIPKSDIHNHGNKGGTLEYYSEWAGVDIKPHEGPFDDLYAVHKWFTTKVKSHDNGLDGHLKRIEGAFVQANKDNIIVLCISTIDALGGIGAL